MNIENEKHNLNIDGYRVEIDPEKIKNHKPLVLGKAMFIFGRVAGVMVEKRDHDSPLLHILTYDDGQWFEGHCTFDLSWLPDLQEVLSKVDVHIRRKGVRFIFI